jgi:hypothetical protein
VSHDRLRMDQDEAVGDRVAGYHCLVRIRHGHVSESCRCGANQAAMGMLMIRSWAWARGVLGVGDRRSGLDGEGDLRGPQIVVGQPPQRTCTLGVLMLGAVVQTVGAGSSVMALGAGHLNATSVQDCFGGMGFAQCRRALGRRRRWVVTGCWFGVRAHGGCEMIAIDLTGRWQAVAKVVHCRGDR